MNKRRKRQKWITDDDGWIYSHKEWKQHVKEQRERWHENKTLLRGAALFVAFMCLGSVLMLPDADNRTAGAIIGMTALGLAFGLIFERWQPREPKHKVMYGEDGPPGFINWGTKYAEWVGTDESTTVATDTDAVR